MRKAQGLSMQTIVIAALALLFLIIMALSLTGRFRFWEQNTGTCEAQGGKCASEFTDERCPDGYRTMWIKGCTCKEEYTDDKSCENNIGLGRCCVP